MIAIAFLSLAAVLGQDFGDLPPLPSELPVTFPTTPQPIRRISPPPAQRQINLPQFQNRLGTNAATALRNFQAYQPRTLGEDVLKWDATEKEYHARPGELSAPFSFGVTNISSSNIVINLVRPSCGCTVAKLPPVPWTLKPGEGGTIDLDVDLKGKYGTLSKYVSVDTSAGQKVLSIRVHIPQLALTPPGPDSRERNMQLAMADRQIVFRGDCASCHATPTAGKTGEHLYTAACAICHDAPHRATMVPDLHALKNATGKEYWLHWITHGKPGTLMPGFAGVHGGPLTDEQIKSLAEFMFEKFPRAESVTASSGLPALKVPGTLSVPAAARPSAPSGGGH